MDKIKYFFTHVKELWSFYILSVAIAGSTMAGYNHVKNLVKQIEVNKITSSNNTMILLEQEIFEIERTHKDNKYSDVEWKYYSIRANELEDLHKELGNKFGWKRVIRTTN